MKKSWIIWLIVGILLFAACGVLLLCLDKIGSENAIFALIGGAVAFFVGIGAFGTGIEKCIDGKRATCKSCKQIMKGAECEIELMNEISKDRSVVAEYEVTVECPFCGEENWFIRKETIAFVDQKGNVRRSNGMAGVEKYCKRLFR